MRRSAVAYDFLVITEPTKVATLTQSDSRAFLPGTPLCRRLTIDQKPSTALV